MPPPLFLIAMLRHAVALLLIYILEVAGLIWE